MEFYKLFLKFKKKIENAVRFSFVREVIRSKSTYTYCLIWDFNVIHNPFINRYS